MQYFNNIYFTDEYLSTITANKKHGQPVKVLDLCCGKGGDLLKWKKGNVSHVICADIAGNAVADCQKRHEDLKAKNKYMFSGEFIVADCTRVSWVVFLFFYTLIEGHNCAYVKFSTLVFMGNNSFKLS